jgi:polyisoprenoid-binding protein YceI
MAWNFDTSHSHLGFTARHMVFAKVRGTFGKWSGTVNYDDANPQKSSVEVNVDTASVDTKEEKRDAHLRSGDFFDSEKHPQMTFKSREVTKAGDGWILAGDLTIRGVTKPIKLEVEMLGSGKDPWGNTKAGFHVKGTINRHDFGLDWNAALEAGGVLVGPKVEIEGDVQLLQST